MHTQYIYEGRYIMKRQITFSGCIVWVYNIVREDEENYYCFCEDTGEELALSKQVVLIRGELEDDLKIQQFDQLAKLNGLNYMHYQSLTMGC